MLDGLRHEVVEYSAFTVRSSKLWVTVKKRLLS